MSMDIYDKFKIIESYFKELDVTTKKEHGKPFFDTQYGIWGAAGMLDVFELFMRMHLEERKGFTDLGSGDGRIVLIAALFTDATGIEGDRGLHEKALSARDALIKQVPDVARAKFKNADYTQEDLSGNEVLFTFCDHNYGAQFEEKLQQEVKGVLLSYNKIFLPQRLVKGRTYWMQQIPVVTYWLGREEEELYKDYRA
jgi:hypothetical protein